MSRVTYFTKSPLGIPLLVLLLFGCADCVPANYPAVSPCPNLFNYQYDTNRSEYYGFINLQTRSVKGSAEVEVSFSIAAQLPSKFIGSIETIGDSSQLLDQITKGRGISYRVNLPIQDPLPQLTKLTLNGRILCTGPEEKGNYVTETQLRHLLRAGTSTKRIQTGLTRPIALTSQLPVIPVPPVTPQAVENSDQFKLIGHREQHKTEERTEHDISPGKNTTSYKYVNQVVTYSEYQSAPIFQKTTHYSVNTTSQHHV
ncbi:serine protease gd-like isoform X2 [Wyeomyia smithii]|uniref:serine protease gd-like isoform X2 n=1 Tax=Wyeomyia smithii TaxID=174621 RepID=UPI002467EC8A|nr:serine protease gd-like isoform X2 [Wyeomyia smithii]